MELHGKNAFITGASRGIGKTIALKLAEAGINLALFARSEKELHTVASVCQSFDVKAHVLPGDITDENSVQSAVKQTLEHFGEIDILVNNAGIGIIKPFVELETEEFDRMTAINLRGTFICTRAVLPGMIERQSGDIVNISSIAGKVGFAWGTGYAATKFGVMGFAESLMHEVREHNVRVINICPGSTNTVFGEHSGDRPHIIQPEDVAELVLCGISIPPRAMVSQIEVRVANPKKMKQAK